MFSPFNFNDVKTNFLICFGEYYHPLLTFPSKLEHPIFLHSFTSTVPVSQQHALSYGTYRLNVGARRKRDRLNYVIAAAVKDISVFSEWALLDMIRACRNVADVGYEWLRILVEHNYLRLKIMRYLTADCKMLLNV